MRITNIDIFRLNIPIEPFAIATGTMTAAQNVYIRVHSSAGIYGVGECSAFPMIVGETQDTCLQLARDFAVIWKGKDPLALSARLAELDSYIARNYTIKSAFDMALHDLAAQSAQVSLFKFLGGANRAIVTDITVGIGTPEEMAIKAKGFADRGASFLKIKLGKDAEEDVRRIKSIRRAIGSSIPIRIDANQGWSYEAATKVLTGIEEDNIQFCEQPMRTYDDHLLPDLRRATTIPIMADESVYTHHDAERLCRDKSCDYINIKLAKSGGIGEAFKIQEVAARYGIPCMIGGMLESRLALTAKFHFALAAANVEFHDLDTCLLGHLIDPVVGGVQIDGYTLSIGDDVIGLGADIAEDYLAGCEKWVV